MNETHYPHTQRAIVFGLVVGGALLLWSWMLSPSEGREALATPTLPPTVIEQSVDSSGSVAPTATLDGVAFAVSIETTETTETTPPAWPVETATITPTPRPLIHAIEQGELLGTIAETYGVGVADILAANDISDTTLLQIGQQLIIPATPTPVGTPTVTPSPTPPPLTHIIEAGDLLLNIAEEYDTSVEAIMIANNVVDPRSLQIGQALIIPPDKGSILGVPTVRHEILGGDTLLTVAARYGSTVEDILATNPDLEPTRLAIGQTLLIPLTQPRANPNVTGPPPDLPARITLPAPLPPELAPLAQRMIAGVNTQRQNNGLPPYTVDEQLTLSAQAHAQDMVTRGYFSHVTPEGANLQDRLVAQGLAINWTGENIQRNIQPYEQSAQYALNWFMNSRVHRWNILHSNYDRFGVGVIESEGGWYTYVLVFGGE